MYPICAPAAVRLDAETGLSPIPHIGQQPYKHVANPDASPGVDATGTGPMMSDRQRTTSLSNPLFETVGAAPSRMTSHEAMSPDVDALEDSTSVAAVVASDTEPAAAPIEDSEVTSPLTGATQNIDNYYLLVQL